jgi:hypothetical protein
VRSGHRVLLVEGPNYDKNRQEVVQQKESAMKEMRLDSKGDKSQVHVPGIAVKSYDAKTRKRNL